MSPISSDRPILIIGAGVVGLTLAQSLKKDGIPFQIFERDTHADSRAHGWGITVHWALDALKTCLPLHVTSRLQTAQVDPEQGRNDTGRFLLLDLSNAKPRYVIPPAPRLRLNRRLFRDVLLESIDVQWGQSIETFREVEDCIEVTFRDGTIIKGSMLIGADGASSRTRHILCPDTADLDQLPIRMLGVTVRLTPEKIEPLRAIDPLLFQGCHPDSGNFFWFSVLTTPEVNGSLGEDEFYEGQVMLSWKAKGDDDEVPELNKERLAKMKSMALPFETRLRAVIEEIPENTEVTEIKIKDWPSVQWPNYGGKVTLIGDAAHAMTMYRGEAANHGFTDALQLHDALISITRKKKSLEDGMCYFETQMQARTRDAVLLSRQACLDAHDLNALNNDSPLVSKRAIVRTSGIAVTS